MDKVNNLSSLRDELATLLSRHDFDYKTRGLKSYFEDEQKVERRIVELLTALPQEQGDELWRQFAPPHVPRPYR